MSSLLNIEKMMLHMKMSAATPFDVSSSATINAKKPNADNAMITILLMGRISEVIQRICNERKGESYECNPKNPVSRLQFATQRLNLPVQFSLFVDV